MLKIMTFAILGIFTSSVMATTLNIEVKVTADPLNLLKKVEFNKDLPKIMYQATKRRIGCYTSNGDTLHRNYVMKSKTIDVQEFVLNNEKASIHFERIIGNFWCRMKSRLLLTDNFLKPEFHQNIDFEVEVPTIKMSTSISPMRSKDAEQKVQRCGFYISSRIFDEKVEGLEEKIQKGFAVFHKVVGGVSQYEIANLKLECNPNFSVNDEDNDHNLVIELNLGATSQFEALARKWESQYSLAEIIKFYDLN